MAIGAGISTPEIRRKLGLDPLVTPTTTVVPPSETPAGEPNTPASTLTPTPLPYASVTPTTIGMLPSETPAGEPNPLVSTLTPISLPDAAVSTDALNLRAGPGASYPILGSYSRGVSVRVLGKEPREEWLYVEVLDDGNRGWMLITYLQVNVDLTTVLLVDVPVAPVATQSTQPQPDGTGGEPAPQPIATQTPHVPPSPTQGTENTAYPYDGNWQGISPEGFIIRFVVRQNVATGILETPPRNNNPSCPRDDIEVSQSVFQRDSGGGGGRSGGITYERSFKLLFESTSSASVEFIETYLVDGGSPCDSSIEVRWIATKQ